MHGLLLFLCCIDDIPSEVKSIYKLLCMLMTCYCTCSDINSEEDMLRTTRFKCFTPMGKEVANEI